MSMEEKVRVAGSVMSLIATEEKRHRAATIAALRPAMTAYETKKITAEEYEETIGETFAATLHRKFNYELQDARDEARAYALSGSITQGEAAALVARVDAAGAPDGNSVPVVQRDSVILTPIGGTVKGGESDGE